MAKNFRRMLAMVLVLFVFASALPMQALAAEIETSTETSPEGLVTNVITTKDTETDEDGNTVITITIEKNTEGVIEEDGKQVTLDRNTTEITTTVEKPDGSTTTETEKSGTENKAWEEEVLPGEEFEVPSVNVGATEYEVDANGKVKLDEAGHPIPKKDANGSYEISGSATGTPKEEVNGSTTTTTTDNREITGSITITGESFVIDGENSDLYCPVAPEDYEGKEYYDYAEHTCNRTNCPITTEHYREGLLPDTAPDYGDNLDKPENSEEGDHYEGGYDMTFSGYGDMTNAAAPMVATWDTTKYEHPYLVDEETGEIVYEYGQPVYDMTKVKFVTANNQKAENDPTTGYKPTGMILSPTQFALKHENGEIFYAYCMDASTGLAPEYNRWYNIRNIEDAIESDENPDGYLTEEEAGKIRAIATTGYWGSESGQGSVESLKELLRSVYTETDTINVYYPNEKEALTGNPENDNKPFNIHELIDGLTESEALAVTQAAIWTFANNQDVTYRNNQGVALTEGASIIGILSASKYHNSAKFNPDGSLKSAGSWLNEYRPAEDYESDARMRALYLAMLNLDPIATPDTSSNVIPGENVITEVGLVIKDKAESEEFAEVNNDKNTDNDVYEADVTFTLAFVPDKDSDNLLVYLIEGYNEKGEPIIATDKDGKAIVRRLAGTNTEEEDAKGIETITAVDGVYTLTGLELGENAEHKFDIKLSGTQYLENGVYIYQAHGGRNESQTLVGLANGSQTVSSTTSLSLTFEVDEKRNVVASTVLFEEAEEETDPQEVPPPVIFRLDVDTTEEIPEEPVPLAAPVVTGDTSFPWMLVVIMAMFGVVLINVTGKKGKYEAI